MGKNRGLGDVGVPAKSLKICVCPMCFFFQRLVSTDFGVFVFNVFFLVCVSIFLGFLNGAFPLRVSIFSKGSMIYVFNVCFSAFLNGALHNEYQHIHALKMSFT